MVFNLLLLSLLASRGGVRFAYAQDTGRNLSGDYEGWCPALQLNAAPVFDFQVQADFFEQQTTAQDLQVFFLTQPLGIRPDGLFGLMQNRGFSDFTARFGVAPREELQSAILEMLDWYVNTETGFLSYDNTIRMPAGDLIVRAFPPTNGAARIRAADDETFLSVAFAVLQETHASLAIPMPATPAIASPQQGQQTVIVASPEEFAIWSQRDPDLAASFHDNFKMAMDWQLMVNALRESGACVVVIDGANTTGTDLEVFVRDAMFEVGGRYFIVSGLREEVLGNQLQLRQAFEDVTGQDLPVTTLPFTSNGFENGGIISFENMLFVGVPEDNPEFSRFKATMEAEIPGLEVYSLLSSITRDGRRFDSFARQHEFAFDGFFGLQSRLTREELERALQIGFGITLSYDDIWNEWGVLLDEPGRLRLQAEDPELYASYMSVYNESLAYATVAHGDHIDGRFNILPGGNGVPPVLTVDPGVWDDLETRNPDLARRLAARFQTNGRSDIVMLDSDPATMDANYMVLGAGITERPVILVPEMDEPARTALEERGYQVVTAADFGSYRGVTNGAEVPISFYIAEDGSVRCSSRLVGETAMLRS
ncbi:MAG: hypothetical protein J0L97_00735 [Alphaproteobacteria bacterium]|nr:hypothetical protein [Alphaproteobacteria bacterium]